MGQPVVSHGSCPLLPDTVFIVIDEGLMAYNDPFRSVQFSGISFIHNIEPPQPLSCCQTSSFTPEESPVPVKSLPLLPVLCLNGFTHFGCLMEAELHNT